MSLRIKKWLNLWISIIPAALKKDGEFNESRTRALSEETFHEVMDMVYNKCAKMTKSILEGKIDIEPYKKPDGTIPCSYCEYISICQFDRSLGNKFRFIGTANITTGEGGAR
jgi:ATP-dependent helicase/nuclease subunit B